MTALATGRFALTFDDGPDPRWTPAVLAELARLRAPATFFVLSPRAAEWPALIERIVADGHAVELHGQAHLRHPDCSRREIEADTDAALAALASLDVHPCRWRLPWGLAAPFSEAVARARGLELCGWTVDTHDWRGDRAEAMAARAVPQLAGDAVVLAHDGLGPGARRTGAGETVRLIEPLIRAAAARGLAPAHLGELGTVTTDRSRTAA